MIWISAIGLALGGTYLMCMPLRVVQHPSIFWSTFALSYFSAVAVMYYIQVKLVPQIILGVGGLAIAFGLSLLRKTTQKLEQDYEQARRDRGEMRPPQNLE